MRRRTGATCYELLPWEDWRAGRPAARQRILAGAAPNGPRQLMRSRNSGASASRSPSGSAARAGTRSASSIARAALRAGLCAKRGGATSASASVVPPGGPLAPRGLAPERRPEPPRADSMAVDHRRILATALGRLRGKLKYRPVVFELLPPFFTLLQLKGGRGAGGRPPAQAELPAPGRGGGLVEGPARSTPHRRSPGRAVRFRREVLRERPAPAACPRQDPGAGGAG